MPERPAVKPGIYKTWFIRCITKKTLPYSFFSPRSPPIPWRGTMNNSLQCCEGLSGKERQFSSCNSGFSFDPRRRGTSLYWLEELFALAPLILNKCAARKLPRYSIRRRAFDPITFDPQIANLRLNFVPDFVSASLYHLANKCTVTFRC